METFSGCARDVLTKAKKTPVTLFTDLNHFIGSFSDVPRSHSSASAMFLKGFMDVRPWGRRKSCHRMKIRKKIPAISETSHCHESQEAKSKFCDISSPRSHYRLVDARWFGGDQD